MDFALVQTILRLNIERGRIVLLTSEYREHNSESYQHQRIRIFLPPVAEDAAEGVRPSDQTSGTPPLPRRVAVDAVAEFVGTLEENLDAWASRGILSERPGKITLSVGSVVTHEIWLDVTDKRFSPAPAMALQHPPRLTIVMNDLGDDLSVTESLLALPIPVTFAVLPSSAFARETAEAAWQAGCEVLIHQPMQSTQWPYVKAGSDELTVDMSGETVATVLRNAQEKIPHASGLNNRMGVASERRPESDGTDCSGRSRRRASICWTTWLGRTRCCILKRVAWGCRRGNRILRWMTGTRRSWSSLRP